MDFKNLESRKAVVSGRFYPKSKTDLHEMVNTMFKAIKTPKLHGRIRALIVPHAGYVFSGKVAANAYAMLNKISDYKRIFYLASSHYTSFDGASIFVGKAYETPLGQVPVDVDVVLQLLQSCDCFEYYEHAHEKEHSIEVQLPFTQVHLDWHPPIIPIVLGTQREIVCKRIAEALSPWFSEDHLFIISTDLSHYPSYDDAVKQDKRLCDAVVKNDADIFLSTREAIINAAINDLKTPMCGWTSVLALLYLTEKRNFRIHLLDYKNSGDASPFGDKNNVVGYGAFAVTEKI